MASEIKAPGLDLGFVIAFVAPGFVGFLALSYHMPAAGAWMDAASKGNQGVGVFLFVLLASLAMGLIVSGVRALSIDKLLRWAWLLGGLAVPEINFDWARLEDEKLPVLLTVRDAYFRHYQFYSNTLVALILWLFSHATAGVNSLSCGQRAVTSICLIALLLSARDSLIRYTKAANQIFKSQRGGRQFEQRILRERSKKEGKAESEGENGHESRTEGEDQSEAKGQDKGES